MSERYSFCTEYSYCERCIEAFRKAVEQTVDFSQTNRGLATFPTTHILAGFGGGLSPADSRNEMEMLKLRASSLICHPLRFVAIYDDDATEVFEVTPLCPRPSHS